MTTTVVIGRGYRLSYLRSPNQRGVRAVISGCPACLPSVTRVTRVTGVTSFPKTSANHSYGDFSDSLSLLSLLSLNEGVNIANQPLRYDYDHQPAASWVSQQSGCLVRRGAERGYQPSHLICVRAHEYIPLRVGWPIPTPLSKPDHIKRATARVGINHSTNIIRT